MPDSYNLGTVITTMIDEVAALRQVGVLNIRYKFKRLAHLTIFKTKFYGFFFRF